MRKQRSHWPSQTRLTPQTSLPLQRVDSDERACLDWFVHRTATKLPGAFHSDFWRTLLLQSSLVERAVLHAILTLTSVHRTMVSSSGPECTNLTVKEVFTLQHCNQAIKLLRYQILERDRTSRLVALIICAVFIHLEYLRGCYQSALIHLNHGLVLLDETQDSQCKDGIHHHPESGDISQQIMVKVFRNLYIQARLMAQDIPHTLPRSGILEADHDCKTYQPVGEARQTLEILILQILQLGDRYNQQNLQLDQSLQDKFNESRSNLRRNLDSWHESLRATTQLLESRTSPLVIDQIACKVLFIYHTMASTMLETCLPPNLNSPEAVYDSHTFKFATIISRSIDLREVTKSYRTQASQTSISEHSIADIGWLPALYYTALKCRVHRLRLQVIRMLGVQPHKEGICDSQLMAIVAKKVMEIEEGDFYQAYEIDEDWPTMEPPPAEVDLPPLPVLPIERRIRIVQLDLPEGAGGQMVLKYVGAGGAYDGKVEKTTYDLRLKQWMDGA